VQRLKTTVGSFLLIIALLVVATSSKSKDISEEDLAYAEFDNSGESKAETALYNQKREKLKFALEKSKYQRVSSC